MGKNLLTVKDLTVNVEEKEILHGVNLTIGKGETHVLLGPNGTGKSTLGNTLLGNPKYNVTRGEIWFQGKNITEEPVNERAKMGLFLRSTMLADGLTRYEYTQGDHVHHAVCLSCNKIFPVEVRLEPEYKDRLAEENGFEVTEHRVEIYGFCKECKARGMDKEFKERMI